MAQPSQEQLVQDLTTMPREQAAAAQEREQRLVSMMENMLRGQGQMQSLPSTADQNTNVSPLKLPEVQHPHRILQVRLTSENLAFEGASLRDIAHSQGLTL